MITEVDVTSRMASFLLPSLPVPGRDLVRTLQGCGRGHRDPAAVRAGFLPWQRSVGQGATGAAAETWREVISMTEALSRLCQGPCKDTGVGRHGLGGRDCQGCSKELQCTCA